MAFVCSEKPKIQPKVHEQSAEMVNINNTERIHLVRSPDRTTDAESKKNCETFRWYFPLLFSLSGCLMTTCTLSALCNSFFSSSVIRYDSAWLFRWDFRLFSIWSWFHFPVFSRRFSLFHFENNIFVNRCGSVPVAKHSFAARWWTFFWRFLAYLTVDRAQPWCW